MKRVRAKSLVLVNWLAVFYENYALDDHVTALEGDNGAGKTTVMIAAYVVLLPDLTRLRFTNVGEGEATGGDKGIHGRLGKSGRPSYAVIEFEIGQERLLAGIRLEPKGEPAVELTPFVISDLPPRLSLQDLLLVREGDEDLIPELAELRENAVRLGARFHRCQSVKEYFTILFERGVTPLRLVGDEDRNRFSDMLRTSMTGGISRALTAELRSFLLKEERALADTLMRMKGNLDACRRTRTEVQEARTLEREISAVYEAGHTMFAAAMAATRERAEEMRRRVDEAAAKCEDAARERDAVARERDRKSEEQDEIAGQIVGARAALQEVEIAHARLVRANEIAGRLATLDRELASTTAELESANELRCRAEAERDACSLQQQRAEDDYNRAAEGLADLQKGLEEYHRRADAHRKVKARLVEACDALGIETVATEQIDDRRAELQKEKQNIDLERGRLDDRITGAREHRRRHDKALQALREIVREDELDDVYEHAVAALAELARLEDLAKRLDDLNEELATAQAQAERQRAAKELAQSLGRRPDELTTLAAVKQAFRDVGLSLSQQQEQLHSVRAQLAEIKRLLEAHDERQRLLERRGHRWRELDALASRLERDLGAALRSAEELDAARDLLDERADQLRQRRDELASTIDQANTEARTLEQSGGAFPDDLLAARDAVEGELLAGYFDDIGPDQAGRMQAVLGPLAEAIVVEEVRGAATRLTALDRKLETIWLVEGTKAAALVEFEHPDLDGGRDVTVAEGGALRITRIPNRPTLGRKARLRRIEELRERAEAAEDTRAEIEGQLGQISTRRRETMVLLADLDTLIAGDPADELRQIAGERRDATKQEQSLRERLDVLTRENEASMRWSDGLRELLAEAHWLDHDDLGPRVVIVAERCRDARRAREEVKRTRQARTTLARDLDALRQRPSSDTELADMKVRLDALGTRRQTVFSALDALDYVAQHREALAWTDAEAVLDAKQALLPALHDQRDRIREERERASVAARRARETWETAHGKWQEIDGRYKAIGAQLERERHELAETGVDDPSDAALARVQVRRTSLEANVEALEERQRGIDRDLATLGERLRSREQTLADLQDQLAALDREWQPSLERWERLRAKAEADNLVTVVIAKRLLVTGIGSVNLNSEARAQAKLLLDRLGTARGGDEILERIRSWIEGQEQTAGDNYLQAWSVVRDWLRRRVPAQVAEVDDPLEALERLRNHLVALDARLARDEDTLRGTSADVANGINVHIRAAHRQVKVLNQTLETVHFGTIRSMQIKLERKPDMDRVLEALRKGEAQELLFSSTMPIEQALEELFARHGGSRTGGQKLLDYREYLTITVEILRQADTTWERVNPSRVSTGEAIGIGAALMMVVLTAWEHSAKLLRSKGSICSLRLLFLDEANRLSRDNLEVLFDLCKSLDLQLLIAAPEVAQAQGCTTYRLVRRKTANGEVDVLVSGRRMRAEGNA
jgi:chromosome partition protein MukB